MRGLNHPPYELILHRRCLDVSKASYILRCNGDKVSDELLEEFDRDSRNNVEETLSGRLPEESWIQAVLGIDAGGLGLKEAKAIALPAFIASRVASRPLLTAMCVCAPLSHVCRHSREGRVIPRLTGAAAFCVRISDFIFVSFFASDKAIS